MNPLFKHSNNGSVMPTVNDFKAKLAQMDKNFLIRMQQEARRRGISEQDISKGLQIIQQLQSAR